MSGTLLLTDVRPFGGPSRDLLVVDGRIARVGERLEAPEDAAVVDGRGHLAVPGLVDRPRPPRQDPRGLPWRPHTAGAGLAELIANGHRGRAELAALGIPSPRQPAATPPVPAGRGRGGRRPRL